jgi:hypothetical protein
MHTEQSPGEKAYNLAFEYEQKREHCAQCTLIAIMETCDSVNPELIKAVDGLTGGAALSTQGTCGALAAGLLAVSSVTGRSYQAFQLGDSDHTWTYVQQLMDQFNNKYGSPLGYKVQEKMFGRSFNLRDQNERTQFKEAGAHVDKCPTVCGTVAKWAVEILLENEELRNKLH